MNVKRPATGPETTPLDLVRAHAAALGFDPEAFETAAKAHIDQAEAWQRSAKSLPAPTSQGGTVTTERDLEQGRRIADNVRYLNLPVVIAAAIADERERVLNLARKALEFEVNAYPDASPAVTSGIFGGFDQWAAACIDGHEVDPDDASHRFDCTCGCTWGAHRGDGSCEDCDCMEFDESDCQCVGLMHREDCPEWTLPR